MKLQGVQTESVRGVPDGEYAFAARGKASPNPVTFVTGDRGSGKTALLEAIVALKELVGSYGRPVNRPALRATGATHGMIRGTFLLSAEERQLAELDKPELDVSFPLGEEPRPPIADSVQRLFERYGHDSNLGKLEYFCAERTLAEHGEPTTERLERALRLSSSGMKYAGLVPSIVEKALADGVQAVERTGSQGIMLAAELPDALKPYRVAMAALIPEVRLRGLHLTSGGPSLAFEHRDRRVVDAWELSGGQKQGVLFAGTIVRIGLSGSLVLVDQPELFQASDDQKRFVEALVSLGDDNQWIVATGSSEVLRAGRRENTIVLGGVGRAL